jgi:hypothetical protein
VHLYPLRRQLGPAAFPIALLLLIAAGCAGRREEVRGRPPTGAVTPVSRLAALPANGTVTVRGTMVEK